METDNTSTEGQNPSASPNTTNEPLIEGHTYDGIQEFDNPMPGWWIWIFIGSVIFAVYYVLGINVFGFINTYEDQLEASLEDLAAVRASYAAAQPVIVIDEATLAEYAGNTEKIEAGAVHFAAQCVACHGPEGQGLIGPNLTDNYWLKGHTNTDIYTIITEGSLEKGMPPWEPIFSLEQRAELVAYVRSLVGTNPPNPKAPEGELVEETSTEEATTEEPAVEES